jgi:MoxR-like ATPase
MDHFPIIQALARTALGTGNAAVRRQIERLRDAAREAGDTQAAQSLDGLLAQSARATEMAPSRMTQSRLSPLPGEILTPNTPVPVDRETAMPLADVIFPDRLPESMPLFDESLTRAAQSLVEEWRHAAALAAAGVAPSRTCLIYGPPGTGKTSLALWLARQLDLPVVVARLDGLISSFLGTTARNVGHLFNFANRYRCLLILDEFDAVAKVRDDPHEVGEIKRVVNALLQNVDGRRGLGITIAITNHESLLDPAIWRRFEIQLKVPYPLANARRAIVHLHLGVHELGEPVERFLALLTEGMSGAEIETFIVGLKKRLVIRGADNANLLEALRELVLVNAGRLSKQSSEVLFLEPQGIAQRLVDEREIPFSQVDVGAILGKDKGTISRWLRAS